MFLNFLSKYYIYLILASRVEHDFIYFIIYILKALKTGATCNNSWGVQYTELSMNAYTTLHRYSFTSDWSMPEGSVLVRPLNIELHVHRLMARVNSHSKTHLLYKLLIQCRQTLQHVCVSTAVVNLTSLRISNRQLHHSLFPVCIPTETAVTLKLSTLITISYLGILSIKLIKTCLSHITMVINW